MSTPAFFPAETPDFIPAEDEQKKTAPDEKPELLDRADTAITDTLAPNPENYRSALKTNAIEVPKTLGRELYSGAKSILGIPGGIYHALADKPNAAEGESVMDPMQRAAYRMGVKPIVNAAQDYAGGKVSTDAALDVAPEAIGQGAGAVVGGKLLEMVVPKVMKAAEGIAPKAIPLGPEDAARGLTKAINPSVNEWPNYLKATSQEAGNIKAFADKNNLPLKTQLDWAKAARASADETRGYYNDKILGPHASEQVSTTGTGFKGEAAGEGQTATLGEIDGRIAKINKMLDSAYNKRNAGQTAESLANEPELIAERDALNDVLRKELAGRTGLTPEQIAGVRQRFGRMYTVADKTEGAVNQRQSSAGKAEEGRRDIPLTTAGAVADVINKFRGGPEGIANKNFAKALSRAKAIPSADLPQVSAPEPIAPRGASAWQMRERLGTSPQGTPIPVETTSPEEIAESQNKLAERQRGNVIRQRLADQKPKRIPIWKDREEEE